MTLQAQAHRRVVETPELAPYEDIIMLYDWPNWDEHCQWVIAAELEEIVEWAEEIRTNEQADGEGNRV